VHHFRDWYCSVGSAALDQKIALIEIGKQLSAERRAASAS
jgi:hypothetical protein